MHKLSTNGTNPTVHAIIVMLDFLFEVLFVCTVELAAVLAEPDAATGLVIKTVLTDVTGPDGPWLTTVLKKAEVMV